MFINQLPTPPNEWLYEQTFVENPETGESEEVRSNWCTQHMGEIPDDAPVTDWPKYLYHECTDQQRREWEEAHPEPEPEPAPSPEPSPSLEPEPSDDPANEGKEAEV